MKLYAVLRTPIVDSTNKGAGTQHGAGNRASTQSGRRVWQVVFAGRLAYFSFSLKFASNFACPSVLTRSGVQTVVHVYTLC